MNATNPLPTHALPLSYCTCTETNRSISSNTTTTINTTTKKRKREKEDMHIPGDTSEKEEVPLQPPPPPLPTKQAVHCQICGMDISSKHYLLQIQHVKNCITHRGTGGSRSLGPPPLPLQNNTNTTTTTTTTTTKKTTTREWLKGLELEQYTDSFIEQEIDIDIVHGLSVRDLTELGIADVPTQRRVLHAAAKRKKNILVKGDVKQQKQQQPTLFKMAVEKRGKKQNCSIATVDGNGIDDGAMQKVEKSIFASLYPPVSHHQRHMRMTTGKEKTDNDQKGSPEAAVISSLMWKAAALCQQLTEPLESRIERTRKEKNTGVKEEALGRGGVVFSRVEESRAMQSMKLEALKEELKMHETTVEQLRAMIRAIENELSTNTD